MIKQLHRTLSITIKTNGSSAEEVSKQLAQQLNTLAQLLKTQAKSGDFEGPSGLCSFKLSKAESFPNIDF